MPTTTMDVKSPDSPSSPDTSHIDAIIADLKATEPVAPIGTGGASPIGINADGFIGKDEFFGMFQFVFMAGHGATQLQSLNIEGSETARPASDALYDICEETPSLQFFIKPGGKWMQRAAAIGMFVVPVAMGCKAELAARKQAKVAKDAPAPSATNEPSNEDAMKDFDNATG
ncbi:hypothetical protein QMT40_001439 [Parvibaculaceae bacterium PLY_AMNH_Bact1]|nr:hypothetical protein QMT40_001439 [Parvibaculaceae bacterium PLY_AMNH_Bact1]